MKLFVKLEDWWNTTHKLIKASHGYSRGLCINGITTTTESFNFYIKEENKEFLKNAIVEYENSTNQNK